MTGTIGSKCPGPPTKQNRNRTAGSYEGRRQTDGVVVATATKPRRSRIGPESSALGEPVSTTNMSQAAAGEDDVLDGSRIVVTCGTLNVIVIGVNV
jgi:hypothetical protein